MILAAVIIKLYLYIAELLGIFFKFVFTNLINKRFTFTSPSIISMPSFEVTQLVAGID